MKYVLYLLVFSSIYSYGQEVVPPAPLPPEIPVVGHEEMSQEPVYDIVEVQPEYPGGIDKMMKFLSINFQYPQIDMENGVEGRVFASFVVEKDGSISTIKVLRGVSETLDAEAVRVIKLMPNWKPGTQNGKLVRVKYTIPITAKLR